MPDRRRLLSIVVIVAPLAAAAISLSGLWLKREGHVPTVFASMMKFVVIGNVVFAAIISAASALALQDRTRDRLDDMLGAGVYAFLIYFLIVGITSSFFR